MYKQPHRSSYEVATATALDYLGITYHTEVTFDCSYIKRLRYDFYLPDFNTIIEIDGEQHFHQVKRFHATCIHWGIHAMRDIKKSNFALENGHRLLRVSYDNMSNILDIILDFLSSDYTYYFSNTYKYQVHLRGLSVENKRFSYPEPILLPPSRCLPYVGVRC